MKTFLKIKTQLTAFLISTKDFCFLLHIHNAQTFNNTDFKILVNKEQDLVIDVTLTLKRRLIVVPPKNLYRNRAIAIW